MKPRKDNIMMTRQQIARRIRQGKGLIDAHTHLGADLSMKHFTYKGAKTNEISFPLGGIGTGCIGLAGNGRLIDWEIFNKPNKGSNGELSHFAIKAEADGEVLDARVLNGDLHPPYSGDGHGPTSATMPGVPHFKEVIFKGEYPFAALNFIDESFPGRVVMNAFNPFIPTNDMDSSIPAAFFEIDVENTLDKEVTYTLALSLNNFFKNGIPYNAYRQQDNLHVIKSSALNLEKDSLEYGNMCIACDAKDVSWQEYWYKGAHRFDSLIIFWRDFTAPGKLKNRNYIDEPHIKKTIFDINKTESTLAAHIVLKPGEKGSVRFILSWSFPNCTNYWNPEKCEGNTDCCCTEKKKTWKNFYSTMFDDSVSSAVYSLKNWKRLFEETLTFKNALFSSTLPHEVIDAVSANISILKTPTCLRLEDGSFYGFEGCDSNSGCCEGSCTHVWNYAYALPFLFPKLERSMRDLDFKYNQREDGGMAFRLQLPLGRERNGFSPCADGQFGGVIKAYRDWKISGDTEWLKSNWNAISKSIDFAWAPTNEDKWDEDMDGVLKGRQHHTLDRELFGPNSWLTGFYLAALKAGAEMAEHLGDNGKAQLYRTLFAKGKKWADDKLFNGEYYQQLIDLKDKTILDKYYAGIITGYGGDVYALYWIDEAGEIRHQIGEGCIIDQVLAQWHGNLCGLGEIFDNRQVKKALSSIYKYNFKKSLRNFFNPCRFFAMNDEAGAVVIDWPQGKYKPVIPPLYSEEIFSGNEYQVSSHMIQEGLIEQGLEIVKAVRDRYDGEKRNPWNEFECGSNYARSMASYALLNAFSGFEFDMVKGMIGFNPVIMPETGFKYFWSLDSGWGVFEKASGFMALKVLYGELKIKHIRVPTDTGKAVNSVEISGSPVSFKYSDGSIILDSYAAITLGNAIIIK